MKIIDIVNIINENNEYLNRIKICKEHSSPDRFGDTDGGWLDLRRKTEKEYQQWLQQEIEI